MRRKRAFTLIELLVVIAIIGILAAIIIVLLNSAKRRAQDAQVKSDITSLSQALEIVKVDRSLATTSGYVNVIDGSGGTMDNNIDRWREDGGGAGSAFKRLINRKPTHPLTGEDYWISIDATDGYAIVAKLNPSQTYFCNQGGTTRTLTAMADLPAAKAACAP